MLLGDLTLTISNVKIGDDELRTDESMRANVEEHHRIPVVLERTANLTKDETIMNPFDRHRTLISVLGLEVLLRQSALHAARPLDVTPCDGGRHVLHVVLLEVSVGIDLGMGSWSVLRPPLILEKAQAVLVDVICDVASGSTTGRGVVVEVTLAKEQSLVSRRGRFFFIVIRDRLTADLRDNEHAQEGDRGLNAPCRWDIS